MNIYMAGKIGPDIIWREQFSEKNESPWEIYDVEGGYRINRDRLVSHSPALRGHDYCGPFFIACDHCCFHGHGTHGAGAGKEGNCAGKNIRRADVFNFNMECIQRCDIFIAWFNNRDEFYSAYGTIYEIGYAKALQKRIYIGTPETSIPSDVWFSMAAADAVVVNVDVEKFVELALDPVNFRRLNNRYRILLDGRDL